ncbi:epithelial cell adhesion molecule [Ranitomeya variabilis]|uniref:epithelial cell adhesion molecule n=1 Tax=Ranitomeya variabilis TaxID=490064 RepID=UPI0040563CDB
MKTSAMLGLGAALLCCILITQAQSQDCKCDTHFDGKCTAAGGGGAANCACTLSIGPDSKEVNCSKLIPKCLLMKKESLGTKAGRRQRPPNALIDNDGLYNPDCDADGTFKARQCNGTQTCWCVNSAGVRRTEKEDIETKKCPELVRTYWVIVEMKRNDTDSVNIADVQAALKNLTTTRYKLPEKYFKGIEMEESYIYVNLQQNSSEKAAGEVDIADVGYYMEKDIKGDSLMNPDNKFEILVNGKNLAVKEPIIMFIDEKPHELRMKRLTAGVIAVIVVVVVAIVAGIVVLIITRRKRGKYEKAEMKEMNEMQKELNS